MTLPVSSISSSLGLSADLLSLAQGLQVLP